MEGAKPLMVSHTLKDYESILSDYGFVRVHKSHLVNMKYVTKMDRDAVINPLQYSLLTTHFSSPEGAYD
jgi:DNA-binding LytR/AlgR family response regulator